MEFTIASLKSVEGSVVKLLKEDLPIRISYQLSKFYELLVKEMDSVEKFRQQLVVRYGQDVDGVTRVTEENIVAFNSEYGELMNETVYATSFEPIDIQQILDYSARSELMSKPPISLSAIDIHNLKNVGILVE